MTALGGVAFLALLFGRAVARHVAAGLERGGLRIALGEGDLDLRLRAGRERRFALAASGPIAPRLGTPRLVPGAVRPFDAGVDESSGSRELCVRAPRVGYAFLQGFEVEATVAAGLFVLRAWLPHPVTFTVLPRRFPLRGEPPLRATRAAFQDRAGAGRSSRRGFGLEIRELRDHQPGDPFKHIAWAATARRGKLITREFESNLQLSAWLLVDVSPSMFWGEPGRARIDFALETAWNLASLLLARGDRVGVLLHDERVRLDVPPQAGRGQLMRILEALLEAPHLVHEDRTEVTDRELVSAVARWFRAETRRDFLLPRHALAPTGPRQPLHDEVRLQEAVETLLETWRRRRRPSRFAVPIEDYARDRRHASFRAFCRHAGIPLALDPTPRPGGQARGLEQAVEVVLRARGGPHTLVVLSDLSSADDLESLRRAALGARRHHHAVVALCPSDPAFSRTAGDDASLGGPLGEALLEVAELRARHSLAAVEAILRPAGVAIVPCSPQDVTPRLLQRLDQVA